MELQGQHVSSRRSSEPTKLITSLVFRWEPESAFTSTGAECLVEEFWGRAALSDRGRNDHGFSPRQIIKLGKARRAPSLSSALVQGQGNNREEGNARRTYTNPDSDLSEMSEIE